MLFQIFRLNFSGDMPKMHYFSNKFLKNRQALGALRPQRHLTFNIGDLKFRDSAELWFNYDEIDLQKIVMTSFQ